MRKHLFFICPTDFLESVVRESFEGQHYFISSLGNAAPMDALEIGEIQRFIEEKEINEITLLLSDDNRIVQEDLLMIHLRKRLTELNTHLKEEVRTQLRINTKIYSRSFRTFHSAFVNDRYSEISLN
ncbi:hypothetical protein HZ996_11775 [Cryomorphaceae bacterium]|nr:hypothetical protein HZ996_11775 [Cryomorphaceae bacterium]